MAFSVKCLLLFLLPALLFSSCISIEKRLYRDGFHVNRSTTLPVQGFDAGRISAEESAHSQAIVHVAPVVHEILNSSPVLEMIPTAKESLFPGVGTANPCLEDTIPPKKHPKKDEGPKKFDEDKDVTKREKEIPASVIIGLILGVVTFSCLFWILTVELLMGFIIGGLISSISGFALSLAGLKQIKNKEGKEGKGLAKIGLFLNALFLAAAAIFLIWGTIFVMRILMDGI